MNPEKYTTTPGKKEMNNQEVFVFERKCRHTISRLFSSIQSDPLDFFSLPLSQSFGKKRKEKKRRAKRITPPRSFPTSVLSIRPKRNGEKEGKLSDPDVGHYRWRAL